MIIAQLGKCQFAHIRINTVMRNNSLHQIMIYTKTFQLPRKKQLGKSYLDSLFIQPGPNRYHFAPTNSHKKQGIKMPKQNSFFLARKKLHNAYKGLSRASEKSAFLSLVCI